MSASVTAQANATAAAALVRGLLDAGVTAAVLSPGARSTPLAFALADAATADALDLRVVLDERAAAFLALGRARASGAPVALACTSGSAGAHWLPAAIEAAESGVPLVLLTADRPVELQGVGAPQAIDQRRLFGAFARAAQDLPAPDGITPAATWRRAAVAAVIAARQAPAGPAHLNLAFREPLWDPAAQAPTLDPGAAPVLGTPALPPAALEALARRLAGVARGLIHCGPHAGAEPGFGAAIHALGARLCWPVLAEPGSGARLHGAPAGLVTRGDALARAGGLADLAPELVLRFGRAPHSRALSAWLQASPAAVLGVDPVGRAQDPGGRMEAVIAAAPAGLARGLLEHLPAPPSGSGAWLATWTRREARAAVALDAAAAEGAWGGAAAAALAAAVPAGGQIAAASSLAFRDLDGFGPADPRPRRGLVSRGVNGIDGTLSAAVGAALEGPTALLCGDLAALHDLSGLALMARERPPLVALVVDNGGGGIFDHLPLAQAPRERFERLLLTPQGADLGALCRALGLPFEDLWAGDLRGGLAEALAAGGPAVLRLRVERAEDLARRAAAVEAVAAALASPRGGAR